MIPKHGEFILASSNKYLSILFTLLLMSGCGTSKDEDLGGVGNDQEADDNTVVLNGEWGDTVNGLRIRTQSIKPDYVDGYFHVQTKLDLENTTDGSITVFLKPPDGLALDYPIGASIKSGDEWIACTRVDGSDLPYAIDIESNSISSVQYVVGWNLNSAPQQYDIKSLLIVHKEPQGDSWHGKIETGVSTVKIN